MSGVRASNTELIELGLTLPGFVERSKVIASLPSLGLLTLAGMTPAPSRSATTRSPTSERSASCRSATWSRSRRSPPRSRRPTRSPTASGRPASRSSWAGCTSRRSRTRPSRTPTRSSSARASSAGRECSSDLAAGPAASRVYAPERPRVRPGRRADAALRPARHRALQPLTVQTSAAARGAASSAPLDPPDAARTR